MILSFIILLYNKQPRNGYFTEESAKKMIEKKLNALSTFELKFKNEVCLRCGVAGDPRYIVAPCHTKPEYRHASNKPSSRHTEKQIFKHTGPLIDFKSRTGKKKHTGYRSSRHSGQPTNAYHPGNKKTGSVARVTAAIFTLSLSEWAIWKSHEWHWYDCCNGM